MPDDNSATPYPGKTEFSADEEKQQRAARAAANQGNSTGWVDTAMNLASDAFPLMRVGRLFRK